MQTNAHWHINSGIVVKLVLYTNFRLKRSAQTSRQKVWILCVFCSPNGVWLAFFIVVFLRPVPSNETANEKKKTQVLTIVNLSESSARCTRLPMLQMCSQFVGFLCKFHVFIRVDSGNDLFVRRHTKSSAFAFSTNARCTRKKEPNKANAKWAESLAGWREHKW